MEWRYHRFVWRCGAFGVYGRARLLDAWGGVQRRNVVVRDCEEAVDQVTGTQESQGLAIDHHGPQPRRRVEQADVVPHQDDGVQETVPRRADQVLGLRAAAGLLASRQTAPRTQEGHRGLRQRQRRSAQGGCIRHCWHRKAYASCGYLQPQYHFERNVYTQELEKVDQKDSRGEGDCPCGFRRVGCCD